MATGGRWNRRDWLLLAAVTLFPLLVYHRVWMGPRAELQHFWGDTTGSYWPDLAFFARSIAHGQLPLWNPNDRGGYPFAFDPQPGVLYPLNWLLAVAAAIGGSTPYWLLQLKVLLHPMLAAALWFGWLRTRHASSSGAAVGALAGSLGVFSMQQVHFSLSWPLPFVPLALWCIDAVLERPRRATALVLGAAVGAMYTAGSPPGAFYGSLVIASYGTVRLIPALRRGWRPVASNIGLAVLVAVVLSAPVLWGGALLTSQSVLEERTFAYVASGALRPDALAHFLLHQQWAGLPLYAGVCVVALAVAALVARAPNALTSWALGIAVFGLLLALGDTTPVLRWASVLIPPVGLFRGAARYVYLVQAGLAVLAALGTDALLARSTAARWARRALLVFAAYLVLATVTQSATRAAFWKAGGEQLVLWLGLLAAAAAMARTRHGARLAAALVIIVVGLDLAAGAPSANALRNGSFQAKPRISDTRLGELLAHSSEERVWDEFAVGFRSGSRLGLRDLRGYMDPLRLRRYSAMVEALKKNPNLLARYNVRWVLHSPHPYHGSGHNYVVVGRLQRSRAVEPHLLELLDAKPVAFWSNGVRVMNDEKQLWQTLTRDPTDPAVLALKDDVPESIPTLGTAAAEQKPARVEDFENNQLTLDVDAPSAGVLVTNEAWFPFWKVTVDGQSRRPFPVEDWARGIVLPAGHHRVQMTFRPTGWLAAAALSALTWLALGALALSWLWRRRRSAPKTSASSAGADGKQLADDPGS